MVLGSGRQVWSGFFQFWVALRLGWLVHDPAQCTYEILSDAMLSHGVGGWAVGVDYWWDALWGGW